MLTRLPRNFLTMFGKSSLSGIGLLRKPLALSGSNQLIQLPGISPRDLEDTIKGINKNSITTPEVLSMNQLIGQKRYIKEALFRKKKIATSLLN